MGVLPLCPDDEVNGGEFVAFGVSDGEEEVHRWLCLQVPHRYCDSRSVLEGLGEGVAIAEGVDSALKGHCSA